MKLPIARLGAFFAMIASFLLASLVAIPASAQGRGPVVLAAASLQEAMNAAADGWAAKGHARPVVSFAGSSALARQIAAGAPADMFISADEEWMDDVEKRGLIRKGSRKSFLANDIVLIAPRESTIKLPVRKGFPLARALGNKRLAMADPAAVPAGRYGKEALTNLGVWPSVAPKVASAENVRVALAFVSRGETPLGVVYSTDAKQDPGVRIVGVFPRSSHKPISYPLAILAKSSNRDATGFRAFLLSAEGRRIFTRFGFGAI